MESVCVCVWVHLCMFAKRRVSLYRWSIGHFSTTGMTAWVYAHTHTHTFTACQTVLLYTLVVIVLKALKTSCHEILKLNCLRSHDILLPSFWDWTIKSNVEKGRQGLKRKLNALQSTTITSGIPSECPSLKWRKNLKLRENLNAQVLPFYYYEMEEVDEKE